MVTPSFDARVIVSSLSVLPMLMLPGNCTITCNCPPDDRNCEMNFCSFCNHSRPRASYWVLRGPTPALASAVALPWA